MKPIAQCLATVLTTLMLTLAAVLGVFSVIAYGHGSSGRTASPNSDKGELSTSWAGSHVAMDWSGNPTKVAEADERFTINQAAVPGDRFHRTLTVTNSGNDDGVLTVAVVDATMRVPKSATNQDLEQASNIYWFLGESNNNCAIGVADSCQRVKFSSARALAKPYVDDAGAHQRYPLQQVPLSQGDSIDLTMGWEFPFTETGGNAGLGDSVELSFDVQLLLQAGDLVASSPTPNPTPNPGEPSSAGGPSPSSNAGAESSGPAAEPAGEGSTKPSGDSVAVGPALPFTGANSTQLAVGASGCLLIGLILLAYRRRHQPRD